MAIDPKLVSIKQASDLPSAIPTNAGEFLFFEDNTLQKSPMSDIYDRVASGIKGVATTSTVPSATGFERWLIHEEGTYTNFGGIVVTAADLDVVNGVANNRVILEVNEGVAIKRVERVKGETGAAGQDGVSNVYPFVNQNPQTLEFSKYIKDVSVVNGVSGKIYSLKELYANTGDTFIKVGMYMSNLDGTGTVQIANKVILKTDIPASGNKTYVVSGYDQINYITILADFSGLLNKNISADLLNVFDFQFDPIVTEGGRLLKNGIPKNIYPFGKGIFYVNQTEAFKLPQAIKDVSIVGAELGRKYYISNLGNITDTEYVIAIKSSDANGQNIRTEGEKTVVAEYIDEYKEVTIEPYFTGGITTNILINFKKLKDLNVSFLGDPNADDFFDLFVFYNRLRGGANIPDNIVTQEQLDSELAALNFPSFQYLQTNYKTGSQTDSERQAALNTLKIVTNQISGQAVTAEKIALDVWSQMTAGNVTITNNPDENDIESVGGALRLKENEGHIFLRKGTNITPAVVANWANKTVVIRHGHLLPAAVSLPANVTLVFKGGYIYASAVFATPFAANGANIVAHPAAWIFRNVFNHAGQYITGANTFKATNAYPEWFGCDNGVMAHKAINLCSAQFTKADIILTPNKTYILEGAIWAQRKRIIGYGAILERSVSIDLKVVSALSPGSGQMTIEVENNTEELAKLKVGQQFAFVNREGAARKVGDGFPEIVAINGTSITFSKKDAKSWDVNTSSMVNLFPMIVCEGDNSGVLGLKIDGKKANFTHSRKYWEFATCITMYTPPINLLIKDCIVVNSPSEAIMGGCVNGEISHNFIAHHGGNGIHLSQCNGVNITNNIISDTNQLAGTTNNEHNEGNIAYSAMNYNILVANNILDNGLTGIGGMYTTWSSDIRIIGNVFRRYRTHAIDGVTMYASTDYLREVRDIQIIGNKFYGFEVLKQGEINIPSDIEPTNGATGSAVHLESVGLGVFRNVTISGNLFVNTSLFALKAEGLSVTGNVFNEQGINHTLTPKSELITFRDSIGTFTGNTVINKSTAARTEIFLVNNRDMLISGNTIDSDKPIINQKSSNYILKGNVIKGNAIITNKGRFRDNTVTGTVTVGVTGQDNTKLLVAGNEVEHVTNTITVVSSVSGAVVNDNYLFGAALVDNGTATVKNGNTVI